MSVISMKKGQDGFSLIEVMVAIFVLAIGVLGIIGLQLFAKQNNYDAIQRSLAAAQVSSIVERMRVNTAGLADYVSAAEPIDLDDPDMPSTVCVNCNAAQLAARDRAVWYEDLAGLAEQSGGNAVGGLVAPSACITRTVGTNDFRVTVAWRGRTAMSNPTASTCGEGSGMYGDNDEFRRIYFIDARIE